MTNSMIPYSFVPGTKAKAGEVNANFIALAEVIALNKTSADSSISSINSSISTINSALSVEQNVQSAQTDLDDYKRKGIYFFSSDYTPVGIPKSTSGTLVVLGKDSVGIKQIWFSDDTNPEIFTREYSNSTWGNWQSIIGTLKITNPYYLVLQNGMKIQFGNHCSKNVTYPIAFEEDPALVVSKQGYAGNGDQGMQYQDKTGFIYGSIGPCDYINWIAIGY